MLLKLAEKHTQNQDRLNRDATLFFSLFFFFFLPRGMRHVYVRAWALVCFYSLISTRTFRRALSALPVA